MKAILESAALKNRGVFLTSETEEEKQVLENIWIQNGRPVEMARLGDGQFEITIAPTADIEGHPEKEEIVL